MTDGYDLIAKNLTARHVHTIKFGRCAERKVPVVDIIESAECIGNLLLVNGIPRLMCLIKIGAIGEVERRVDIQIAKQREIAADRYLMLHTVLPVLRQRRVQQLIFLSRDGVAEVTSILH